MYAKSGYSAKDYKVSLDRVPKEFVAPVVYELAVAKFRTSSTCSIDSHPIDELFWHAIDNIREAQKDKQEFALLSNVCCDQDDCPHTIFFRCIMDVLRTVSA
jgi:hypothetical protein